MQKYPLQPDAVRGLDLNILLSCQTNEEILEFLKDKVAKWWIPDRVLFLDEIPKTSVGKFNKKELRETYA